MPTTSKYKASKTCLWTKIGFRSNKRKQTPPKYSKLIMTHCDARGKNWSQPYFTRPQYLHAASAKVFAIWLPTSHYLILLAFYDFNIHFADIIRLLYFMCLSSCIYFSSKKNELSCLGLQLWNSSFLYSCGSGMIIANYFSRNMCTCSWWICIVLTG
jgi:hypothetical protein